ncbi:ATP-binding SpoIIE family protein phosphatase [Streptacidiphilus sp. P02-A3a]|uniref:ATP-binding SpoIIE family protein phosphatase n=1 Tax=Streptacidiphilus sp. P02-A3a TaxID=2704468 RepID=UPI0015FA5730|nr:ATP-binding SpoIIE family protein phosphatase [Streptacidiphilus sp. P02-A3a]QMU74129.1 SpoIIE family protein phosphatase [Streptacidiphilus sp. P02-A3a]
MAGSVLWPLVDCEDVAWFRDSAQSARGAAAALGRRVGLGEQRTAEMALAVAELATNMAKHATDAALLLRVVRTEQVAGVELLVLDQGPGIADVSAAMRDGTSTSGTLGIGLGAVARLADVFDIHSQPGLGTVQLARFWPRPTGSAPPVEAAVSGVTRPIGGELDCGDAWTARNDPQPGPPHAPVTTAPIGAAESRSTGRSVLVHNPLPGPGTGVLVMSCDGLGHGPLAALAARAAVQALRTGVGRTPEQAMQEVHRALRGSRGAAVAIARIEADGRVLFCGVGNITAAVVTPTTRSNLLSHPGIVGHRTHTPRSYQHHLPAGAALVMHSDGLSDRWTPADLRSLFPHRPAVIAAGLLRLAGTRRDDASTVIAKAPR